MLNGIYIHIPFCKSKCPYCDFYSYRCKKEDTINYTNALIDEINTLRRCGEFLPNNFSKADTLYIGGGTPSVLSGEQLEAIINTARKKFNIDNTAEITVECNPSSDIEALLPYFKKCGVNRISLGMQSAVNDERKLLGRGADKNRIHQIIQLLKSNGINNISLDIMLGIPLQTPQSLNETLDFIKKCDIQHVSAYMLKIEEGTYFHTHSQKFNFPDEDTVCDLYEQCTKSLINMGFEHYEISNFAKKGYESRHNTKYWELENYLGIGAAAHSFADGKRFYFESDAQGFINGNAPIFDGYGNDAEEFIMLKLRLKKGFGLNELTSVYGEKSALKIKEKAPFLKEQGLIEYDGNKIKLTEKGFLLSNAVIGQLI